MEESRSTIIIGFVFAYFLLCIGVGLWAMSRTKSTHDFFIAGRNLGVFVTAIAIMSSTMSRPVSSEHSSANSTYLRT